MATPKSSFPGSESDENNENHSSQEQMVSNSQSQVKKAEKNFMSPTVSTTSKVTPKKKVLVERNVNSYVESSEDSNANLCRGFCSMPYDSLTNYLSPRPKFLRFDPNRRQEILHRIENEVNEELSGSVDFRKLGDEEVSSEDHVNIDVSREMENVVYEEIVDSDSDEEDEEQEYEFEEEEDEFEEEEDERGWCLKGVLKVMFALVACLLSISYICSMSSSMHLPSQQAVWKFKDGLAMVQNGTTLESVDNRLCETGFLVMKENDGYFELDEVEIEGYGNVENKEKIVEEDGEVDVDGLNEDLVAINENIADEYLEIVDPESGFEFELEKVEQLEDANKGENEDGFYMMENEEEASHYVSIGNAADIIEAAEKTNGVSGDGEFESEADSSGEMFGVENEMQGQESEDFTQLEEVDSVKLSSDQEEVINQLRELDGMELFDEHIGSPEKSNNFLVHEVDVEMDKQDYGMDLAKPGRTMLFIIGLSVLSAVLASLAFMYRSAKVKTTAAEESKPVKEMTAEPHLAMERKMAPVEEFRPVKELTPEPLAVERKIEYLASVSTTPSIKEASRSNSNSIHVPTVELLGEIDVGYTRSSNSFRSGGRKDDEESNNTRSQEQSPLPKPLSDPQESFIDEMKNLMRQGGKKVKAAIEVTPVRRSGRIRNRVAAMSP